MQLSYKQSVEIAEEEAISSVLAQNKYDLTRRRLNMDLAVCGIAAAKTSFNTAEGITVDYVDPARLVYSYTEDPNFEDIYYVGEVKEIPINELAKQFPHLSGDDLEDIANNKSNHNPRHIASKSDNNTVQVLYFNWKTYMNEVYKVKETRTADSKIIQKHL